MSFPPAVFEDAISIKNYENSSQRFSVVLCQRAVSYRSLSSFRLPKSRESEIKSPSAIRIPKMILKYVIQKLPGVIPWNCPLFLGAQDPSIIMEHNSQGTTIPTKIITDRFCSWRITDTGPDPQGRNRDHGYRFQASYMEQEPIRITKLIVLAINWNSRYRSGPPNNQFCSTLVAQHGFEHRAQSWVPSGSPFPSQRGTT